MVISHCVIYNGRSIISTDIFHQKQKNRRFSPQRLMGDTKSCTIAQQLGNYLHWKYYK